MASMKIGLIDVAKIGTIKGIPAAEDCHTCKDCKYLETKKT